MFLVCISVLKDLYIALCPLTTQSQIIFRMLGLLHQPHPHTTLGYHFKGEAIYFLSLV